MYLKHYGLAVKPFEITTSPEFVWFGEKHREAYALLRYGVVENKGPLLLTGDVGVGKTTLINALVGELSNSVIHMIISDPGVSVMDFYGYLAQGFGLDTRFLTKVEFLSGFRGFLQESYKKGKKVLLIIDEAQRMDQGLLEDVRLLSNIENDGIKLINVFFVGQTEFLETLSHKRTRALRQRIAASHTIEPLVLNETYRYIAARLKKAGAQTNFFTKAAIEEIHLYSGGAPRMINALCDMAMMVGYSKGVKRLEKQTIRDGARKLPGIVRPVKKSTGIMDGPRQAAPQKRLVTCSTPEDSEKKQAKRSSGLSVLMAGTCGALFVAVALALVQRGGVGTISSYVKGWGADVAHRLESNGQVGGLEYPVSLLFLYDSGMMDPRSVPLIQAVASSLKQDRDALVVIKGYAHGTPKGNDPMALSLAKAEFVKRRLTAAGIAKDRIRVFGMGGARDGAPVPSPQGDKTGVTVEVDLVN
ncbi:hypothetical protein DSLASN_27110 [Desulfoluna limicola]|uniref:OmpA-like domain-containing protein n=1 Tax=Desulfoluna limicola TaxID=2810562 RepID=A0ABM7PHL7_9BACT|nr:AAA family ATPase [Desulfoluna limicola]BCS97079.1 hypothetical protein DSLASN_27110 [Desulfoluna limicola]